MEISTWTKCYEDSWKDHIVPEAFSHPAKMSYGLMENTICIKCNKNPIHIKKTSLCKTCYSEDWRASRANSIQEIPDVGIWINVLKEIDKKIEELKQGMEIAKGVKIRIREIAERHTKTCSKCGCGEIATFVMSSNKKKYHYCHKHK